LKKILFTDLDDTLFQSHRKAPPGDRWLTQAYLSDGSPVSFSSPQQQSVLEMFQHEMTIIPVTARNYDAYRRVNINFTAEAVLNYGGVILNSDGTPDESWLKSSRTNSRDSEEVLHLWMAMLEAECESKSLDLRVRIISDFGIPFYLVAKSKSGNVAVVQAGGEFCKRIKLMKPLQNNVFIHTNHNNLALIPKWLNKRHAVEFLCDRYTKRHSNVLSFGMGDSLVDLGFMGICDYSIIPSASQIFGERLGDPI
jgi:hydroxymethylpyrimidine pyrophosphatase-like HAD family hydrolase